MWAGKMPLGPAKWHAAPAHRDLKPTLRVSCMAGWPSCMRFASGISPGSCSRYVAVSGMSAASCKTSICSPQAPNLDYGFKVRLQAASALAQAHKHHHFGSAGAI